MYQLVVTIVWAGIKIIDTWMLFSLCLPFLDVLIQTWTNVCLQRMRDDLQRQPKDKRGRPGSLRGAVGSQLVAVKPLYDVWPEEERQRSVCTAEVNVYGGGQCVGSVLGSKINSVGGGTKWTVTRGFKGIGRRGSKMDRVSEPREKGVQKDRLKRVQNEWTAWRGTKMDRIKRFQNGQSEAVQNERGEQMDTVKGANKWTQWKRARMGRVK